MTVDLIELAKTCSFCKDEAFSRYLETLFCSRHLIVFYLGLKYTGYID